MEIILQEDIEKLGTRGEVVTSRRATREIICCRANWRWKLRREREAPGEDSRHACQAHCHRTRTGAEAGGVVECRDGQVSRKAGETGNYSVR